MNKTLPLILGLGIFLAFTVSPMAAQDQKKSTVSITITEGDKVTVDTTLELKEGQDPEMIKKIVSHLAGEDIDAHQSKSMSHAGIAMIHSDDDVVWHAGKGGDFEYHFGDFGIDIDSIKEAHKGEKILVMKDEDGEFTVKELGEDDEGEKILKLKDQHVVIMTEEGDEEGETTVIVKSMKPGEEMEMEKTVNVLVTTGEDGEGSEENVDIYIIKEGGKDVKVVKKQIKVEIDDEGEKEPAKSEMQNSENKVKKEK